MKKILVCGGREYKDEETVFYILDALMDTMNLWAWSARQQKHVAFCEIIHGGAKGADSIAHSWAVDRGAIIKVYKAEWEKHGNAAGPIRNTKMLHQGKPDLVVAFPGGKGTAHMVGLAENEGVEVKVIT